jgi:hypothetical protein
MLRLEYMQCIGHVKNSNLPDAEAVALIDLSDETGFPMQL